MKNIDWKFLVVVVLVVLVGQGPSVGLANSICMDELVKDGGGGVLQIALLYLLKMRDAA